ncbi:RHS repeat-associated core domain-containing protein [Pseudomonas purpurea]|uniref:RHS repeat domain-containing protein n=1 Tax=Pseudomonas purpurea TaxID=3136737 RepID=UPI0032672AD4
MTPTLDLHTPTLRINDGRGLPVRHVAYWRNAAGATAQALPTRQVHDALGRLIEQWDPRLYGSAPKPNVASVYRLSGTALRVDSVDAGQRLSLAGIAHQELQRWDARGTHWQTDYDDQLRIVAVHQRPTGQAPDTLERLTYADHSADPAFNRRGQLIRLVEPSGELNINRFSLHGQRLEETRTFADGPVFTSLWQYSATARLLVQTDAAGHRQISRFNVAGQLKAISLHLKEASAPQNIVSTLEYNAFNQVESKITGNGVFSHWTYNPADGRLSALKSGVAGESLQQNLSYVYDPVGNVLHIDDHTLPPVFFANQRIDGHRSFIYDSLYQLISASGFEGETPHLLPGLPELNTPADPGPRFNYSQHYDYDLGGNLIRLRHVRDGHCYTQSLRIAPHSNRGLPWKEGDPDPGFDDAFDAHGNLQALNNHQPLRWNTQDQLAGVTLIRRKTGLDDEETYAYSQGARVFKHQVSQAKSVSHSRAVRYLPGLEIRTLDDREELHVITLPGSVRCLHWVKGQPVGIDKTQLRYSLDDHLGSSSLELGEHGERISHEVYYPFGGTAWWAARSAVDADYKTVRYSGKEMDASGLYYYGLRYYAPWLQRWINPDPGGDVDGLNLYAMVGNNPVTYLDLDGGIRLQGGVTAQIKATFANGDPDMLFDLKIHRHLEILSLVKLRNRDAGQQILNHRSSTEHALSTTRRTGTLLLKFGAVELVSTGVGAALGAPGGPPLMAITAAAGFIAGKAVKKAVGYGAEKTGTSASVSLNTRLMAPDNITREVFAKASGTEARFNHLKQTLNPTTAHGQKNLKATGARAALGSVPLLGPGLKTIPNLIEVLHEVDEAGTPLSAEQVQELDNHLVNLATTLDRGMTNLQSRFTELGRDEALGYTPQRLREKTNKVINQLKDTRTVLHSRSSRFTAV